MASLSEIVGGGGTPIDGIISLNRIEDEVVIQGSTYLRGGVLETDPSVYPKASVNPMIYISKTTMSNLTESVEGTTYGGGNIWTSNTSADNVKKFTVGGNSASVAFSVTNPYALAYKDGNIWVASNSPDTFTEYTTSGTPTGNSFSLVEAGIYNAAVWDGNHFYLSTGGDILQYTDTGTLVNTFNPSTGTIQALTSVDGNFWAFTANTRAYELDSNLVRTGKVIELPNLTSALDGACYDGTNHYVISDAIRYKYLAAIGFYSAVNEGVAPTNYVRVD